MQATVKNSYTWKELVFPNPQQRRQKKRFVQHASYRASYVMMFSLEASYMKECLKLHIPAILNEVLFLWNTINSFMAWSIDLSKVGFFSNCYL